MIAAASFVTPGLDPHPYAGLSVLKMAAFLSVHDKG
jgi:hypothetical protein